MASDEEFNAGVSTTASPSVKQVTSKFATPTDISTATSGLASQEWVNRQILAANPTGTIITWSTATAPTGYLICDGSAISRTTYSNLFSVIGTIYGEGDGASTFNLPNGSTRLITQNLVPVIGNGIAMTLQGSLLENNTYYRVGLTVGNGDQNAALPRALRAGYGKAIDSGNAQVVGLGTGANGYIPISLPNDNTDTTVFADLSIFKELRFCIKY